MSSAADYYGGSAVPPTTAYGPPKIDFSPLADGLDTYVKGKQLGRQEDQAEAFRNGIPRDPSGNFDVNKTVDIMARHDPSLAMPLLQMQIANQYGAQDAAASAGAGAAVHGGGQSVAQGQPQVQPQAQPSRGGSAPQQPTIMSILEGNGIPNDQWEAAGGMLSRQLGVGLTDPINTSDPQVKNVLIPALARLRTVGKVQPPGDNAPQAGPLTPEQLVAHGRQSQGVPAPVDADPENSARLAAANRANQEADRLQARAIATARNNPKAAEGMQKQVDQLRAEANKNIDAVNSDVARTETMKNAEASGHASPERATTREAELKDEVARSSKTYAGLQGVANQYQTDLKPALDISRSLLSDPDMQTGMGSGVSQIVNRAKALAGYPKAAMLQEALTKITATSVLSQINAQKAQLTEMGGSASRIFKNQAELIEKAAPALSTTPSGNRFLINVADKMGQFSTRVAEQARDYIDAHGHLDAKFDRQISNYLDKNPVFSTDERKNPSLLAAPDAPPDIGGKEHALAWIKAMGLKPGEPFRLPDGNIRYVPYKGPNLGPLQPSGSAAAK